jgi:hypothetical protein
MSELIKELAKQAGMTDDKFGMYFASDKHNEDGVDLEKFAELMLIEFTETVKHTAILVAQTSYNDGETGANVTKRVNAAMRVLDVMRERFGVENV